MTHRHALAGSTPELRGPRCAYPSVQGLWTVFLAHSIEDYFYCTLAPHDCSKAASIMKV